MNVFVLSNWRNSATLLNERLVNRQKLSAGMTTLVGVACNTGSAKCCDLRMFKRWTFLVDRHRLSAGTSTLVWVHAGLVNFVVAEVYALNIFVWLIVCWDITKIARIEENYPGQSKNKFITFWCQTYVNRELQFVHSCHFCNSKMAIQLIPE